MVRKFIQLYKDGESGTKQMYVDASVSLIRLEVIGGGSLTIRGTLDTEEGEYPLCAIKSSDYSTVNTMTQGLYMIEVSGIYKLVFELTGSAEVNLKTIV